MMNTLYISLQPIFRWVLQTSIVCSLLVCLIMLVKVIFRSKLPARWHYLLWLTLVFRLIMPPLPENLFNYHNVIPVNHFKTTIIESIPTQEIQSTLTHQEQKNVITPNNGIVQQRSTPIKNAIKKQSVPVEQIVMFVWLTGILLMAVLSILANAQLFQFIKRQVYINDSEIIGFFEQCKKRMRIKRKIPLVITRKLTSPTLLGFIHPKIILSQTHLTMLNESQLKSVFYHELAHFKRKDIFVNCVMNGLLILHWFNPIIWYAYNRLREDQEIGCDALALTYLDESQKTEYGHTIIKLLDSFNNRNPISSIAKMAGGKGNLKRRILMIKQFQKKSYRWSLMGVVSVIGLSLFTFINVDANSNNVIKKNESVNTPLKSDASLVNTNSTANSSTIYIPPKQSENFNNMTKEEILTKMINTVDNFETAKGEFKVHYGSIIGSSDETIDYELSLKKKPGGFSSITYKENGKDKVFYNYYLNGTMWNLNQETGQFYETKYIEPKRMGTLTINKAFHVNDRGENESMTRERPPITGGSESLFPYEIAGLYTSNLNNWQIEKQNEELLGHNTLVIKGTLNDYAKLKHKSNTFRFWVDKDTGILLKYETYNSGGDVVNYLYPMKLEINVPIDSKDFTPNLDGYKKVKMKRGPGIETGNISDNEIPKELQAQWKNASNKPNETIVLHQNDNWYIYVKKGYLVDTIKVDGMEGTLLLAKVPAQKSAYRYKSIAKGFKIEKLKIVYE
jgi:beta-lactamase regulating signal transducer with metallopeptidase domain/outer membrane lipoprotein-sorting protein